MTTEHLALLTIAIFLIALLYSSVGHAGASGYIAVMSLLELSPAVIKPTALVLNIFVACLGSWQFWRSGLLSWRLFFAFAPLSVPFAFLGGYISLPNSSFKVILGVTLLASALRFLVQPTDRPSQEPPLPLSLAIGGGIGLLSGLTGTGGGIFLTPILLLRHWATTKAAAAVSALFILVNSVAGLLGNFSATRQIPEFAIALVIAALAGGSIGSYLGSRRFSTSVIQRLLSIVLIIAGLKLLFT